ncbi:unnamed protein product [Linum trigynum]|uniref:S-protein homolog n=1 Tax=Linum trigynum TaxID=586398 RepID=A0AAV2GWU5_9ROSI
MIRKVVLAAVLLATVTASVAAGYKVTVHVTNKLSSRMVLIVHCKSGDDDLGARALEPDADFGFSFGPSFWGGTFFWCNVAFQDKRLSFVAYDQNLHHGWVVDFDVEDGGVYRHNRLVRGWK